MVEIKFIHKKLLDHCKNETTQKAKEAYKNLGLVIGQTQIYDKVKQVYIVHWMKHFYFSCSLV
jgi:hypothetical protein